MADSYRGNLAPVQVSSSSSPLKLASGISGMKLAVLAYQLMSSAGGLVQFTDGSGGAVLGSVSLKANEPYVVAANVLSLPDQRCGIFASAGNDLYLSFSAGTINATALVEKFRPEGV